MSTFKEDKCERGDSSVPEYEEASNVGSIHEQQDDVFGEISEGGPNYRNVSPLSKPTWPTLYAISNIGFTGWLARNRRVNDEDHGRPGRLIRPGNVRRSRADPRRHLPVHRRRHHHLVGLHDWRVQAATPASLRHRGRRPAAVWSRR